MSQQFIHEMREKVIKMEKISEIQETLQTIILITLGGHLYQAQEHKLIYQPLEV